MTGGALDVKAAEEVASVGLKGPEAAADSVWTKARAATISRMRREPTEVPIPNLPKTIVRSGQKPTRVYHGTLADFRKFDQASASRGAQLGEGLYFSESPKLASEHAFGAGVNENIHEIAAGSRSEAERAAKEIASGSDRTLGSIERDSDGTWVALMYPREGAPNVHAAYLDIRNPFPFDAKRLAPGERNAISAAVGGDFKIPAEASGEAAYLALQGAVGERVNRVLAEAGFDGIRHAEGTVATGEESTTWIAFNSSQVHSAFEGPFLRPNVVDGRSLADEILSRSVEEPAAFEGWLMDKGMNKLPSYLEAERVVQAARRDIRSGKVDISDQVQGFVTDAEGAFERTRVEGQISELRKQTAELEKAAVIRDRSDRARRDRAGDHRPQSQDRRAEEGATEDER